MSGQVKWGDEPIGLEYFSVGTIRDLAKEEVGKGFYYKFLKSMFLFSL